MIATHAAVRFTNPAGQVITGHVAYITGHVAAVIVRASSVRPPSKGYRAAGAEYQKAVIETVPLAALEIVPEGWQFFTKSEGEKA